MADILLPEVGEGIKDVEISEILVSEGKLINVDDPMILVESEKISMEIPSTAEGIIEKIHVNEGDSIVPGDIIISIQDTEDAGNEEKMENSDPIIETDKFPHIEQSLPIKPSMGVSPILKKGGVIASPSIRRFARELGCDLNLVNGTGSKRRITQEDVQQHIKKQLSKPITENQNVPLMAPGQDLDFAKWGNVAIKPLNKIKRIAGKRLQKAWQVIPQVTHFDKADITKLEQLRLSLKKINPDKNIKVTLLPFIMKAIVIALQEMPQFNSSLDESNENLVLKKYFHLGIAVDTKNGLMVPIIQNVDQKNIKELSKELSIVSQKARGKQLLSSDMEGGCFTISSLGGISGTNFTPIVNPPEVAILGISRMRTEPVYLKSKFRKRKILPFSLSYDHRVIDGAEAARFTKRLGDILSNLEELTTTS